METTENNVTVPMNQTPIDMPTPVVEIPMKRSANKIPFVVVSLVLIAILAFYAYSRQQKIANNNTVTPTPKVTEIVEETPTPTEFLEDITIQEASTNKNITWKTYESKQIGVTFDYPSNFTVSRENVATATDVNEPSYVLLSPNTFIEIRISKGFNEPIKDGNYSPRTDIYGKSLKYTINGELNASNVGGIGDGMPCDNSNTSVAYHGNTSHSWIVGKAITVDYNIEESKECGKKIVEPSASDFATAKKIIESIKLTKDAVVFVPTPTEAK